MSDEICEFKDSDGEKCGAESELVDKNGKKSATCRYIPM